MEMEKIILEKANEIKKGTTFTKIVKKKKAGKCVLILSSRDFGLYQSIYSDSLYALTNTGDLFLLR